ncbi:hypothetical protein roselon_00722 [Roseibacterium elongatum DSM 19469]|uniref:VWFA domain-containing protein n=1 Tax=Roseicyclus elongatus DSM 19469 TaxID=1294273 RepID=W8RZ47_9RHOB|nr:VWA domain-containing protein [Roseibacterium elongatum]AHM03147.1 hypothetical protein roselon_00722 [Roseibacterium elongatum DSM 19469]
MRAWRRIVFVSALLAGGGFAAVVGAQPVELAQTAYEPMTEARTVTAGWQAVRAELTIRNSGAAPLDLSGLPGRIEILEDGVFPYLPEVVTWNGAASPESLLLPAGMAGTLALEFELPQTHGALVLRVTTALGAVEAPLGADVPAPTVDPPPARQTDPALPAPQDPTRTDGPQFACLTGPEAEAATTGALVSLARQGASIALERGRAVQNLGYLLDERLDSYDFFVNAERDAEGVVAFVVSLAGTRAATVSHIALDSRTRSTLNWVPATVRIELSDIGAEGPWTDLGMLTMEDRPEALELFALATPAPARAVRITIGTSWRPGVRLSEIQIFESAAAPSVLSDVATDLAAVDNGGRIARFTSQAGSRDAANILSATGSWMPATNRFPQDITVAFDDFRTMRVTDIALDWQIGPEADWAPRVRVAASTAPGPLTGMQDLGLMTAERTGPDRGRTGLRFDETVPIRWLTLTISDPGSATFQLDRLRVTGTAADLFSSREGSSIAADGGSGSGLPGEVEPNDGLADATPLPMGAVIEGGAGSLGDLDHFAFSVPAGPDRTVNFRLEGRPWIRARLDLIGPDGDVLFGQDPLTAETARTFTWRLPSGTYHVRLSQPAPSIALVIDDSGSMGDAIFTAIEAARLFVTSKAPEEQISLTSFSGIIRPLLPLTTDAAALDRAMREGIDQSHPQGTSVYDAVRAGIETLEDAGGNRAIILLTDGEDVSGAPYPAFWDTIETERIPIYAIGLGDAMRSYTPNVSARLDHMLEAIARGSGGAYFDSPAAEDLPRVWQDIAAAIRAPADYAVSWSTGDDGALAVLENGEEFVSADALGELLFILDASGSMRAATDQGRRRIDVARSLMFDILSEIPDSTPLGLRIYGANLPDQPATASCRDSVLAVPVAPGSVDRAIDAVLAASPRGQTPIGRSLAMVPQDLGPGDRGLVILITDGEETCDAEVDAPFNPERVANDLMARGIDIRVNIVGFDIGDPEVQAGLARVAEVTGGAFYPAEGQAGLQAALRAALVPEIEVRDDLGQVIAETRVGAPAIALPEGHYQLLLGGDEHLIARQSIPARQERRVYVNREGEEVRITSEVVAPGTALPEAVRIDVAQAVAAEDRPVLDRLLVRSRTPRRPILMEERVHGIQARLIDLGFDPGPADGQMGARTRAAADAFLARYGMVLPNRPAFDAGGEPTHDLWFSLVATHTERLLVPLHRGLPDTPELARLRAQ